ncbi:hypothetical protein Y1Q_0024545 [Alligator mississippiensis]|uniref:Uncharacterized protein n=1 Tax=Alligator mississippiensis TaxID=8496 RepID=A0A151NAY1_ALLMI|nr:hypothetical protein Y1Q_0024545 [Alligator mississippiensis]
MEPRHFVFSSWEVERSVVPWSVPDSTFVCGRPRHRSRDAGSRVVPQTPTEHWRHINHFGLILKTVGASTHAVNAIEYTPAQFEPEANINKGSEEIMHVKSLKAFLNKMKYMEKEAIAAVKKEEETGITSYYLLQTFDTVSFGHLSML